MKQTLRKLESIINLICSGNCYSKSELKKTAQLNEHQTKKVVVFFTEFGLAEMSNENQKLKLALDAKKLFTKSI